MPGIHPQRYFKRSITPKQRIWFLLITAALVLIIVSLVMLNMGIRARGELAAHERLLQDRIESELYQLIASYAQTQSAGFTDYRTAVADLRRYLYCANELTSVLTESYGLEASVFDRSIYNQLDSTLAECERALNVGLPIQQPMEELGEAVSALNFSL